MGAYRDRLTEVKAEKKRWRTTGRVYRNRGPRQVVRLPGNKLYFSGSVGAADKDPGTQGEASRGTRGGWAKKVKETQTADGVDSRGGTRHVIRDPRARKFANRRTEIPQGGKN